MKKAVVYITLFVLLVGTVIGAVFIYKWYENEQYIKENSTIEQVIDLKEQIQILINDKNELIVQVTNLQNEIKDKLDIIANKDGDISDLKDDISKLQENITNLNLQIAEKDNKIKYYQELLEAYQDSDKLIVSFIIPGIEIDNVYDVQVVDEGETLGEVVTPDYDKGTFLGWSLEPYGEIVSLSTLQINENTNIYAVFDYTLEAFTWTEINSIANNGLAETYFDVGDKKTISLSNGENSTIAIMRFNHDDLTDESGKAKITFGMVDILPTQYAMEDSIANVTGWEDSKMRNETLTTIYTYLPSDLKDTIKQVDKVSSIEGNSQVTTSDLLWLFSWTEIYGTGVEGSQYEYFSVIENWTENNEILIKNINGTNTPADWWLRSMSVTGYKYKGITSTAGTSAPYANTEYGVSFGFCI